MRFRTVVAWGIVLAAAGGAYLVQRTYGRPAMDMGMEMAVRGGADAGVPVTVARAEMGSLAGVATYAGTVAADGEEDVYPRVTGRIVAMPVYPGDRVERGQVVARLDEVELGSKVREARAGAAAAEANLGQMEADVVAARHGVSQMEREVAMAEADLAAARHGVVQMEREVTMVEADLVAAGHEVHHMGREVAMAEADLVATRHGVGQMERELAMAEAETGYQQAVAARDERLFAKGAVSRQDAESSQAMGAAGRAKVEAGRAKVDQAKAMAVAGEAKVDAARAKLEQVKAAIVAGQARVDAARAKLEQAKAMIVASEARVDGARAKVAQARAMEASAGKKQEAMAAMAAQGQAMLRTAEVVHDYVQIQAANDGYVVKRLVAPGTLVQPGTAILKIAQIDRVRFQANVAERDMARLRVGSPVRVRAPGGESPPLALQVTSVFPFAEASSRTAVAEAVAGNPGRRFLPGQYVVMEFELGDRDDVVSVPRGAVERLGGQTSVWTVHEGVASRRPVKVGPADSERVGILDGLTAGEIVVVSGRENLYEGAKVAVADSRAPAPRDAAQAPKPMPEMKGMTAPQAGAAGGKARIELATKPKTPVVGKNTLVVTVRDPSGTPVTDARVAITYGMPPMRGMPAGMKLDAEAKHRANGEYDAEAQLAMAGSWNVTIVVTRGGETLGTATFNLAAK
jgi:RND family efflux transporter MFP subunit